MSPHNAHLLLFALFSIVLMVALVAWAKIHPFLSLVVVSLGLGLVAGMPVGTVVKSFETGVGNVLGHIAVVVALGTMMGKLMADSGGANCVASTLIRAFGERHLPWAMMLIGILVGLPVFFEVGFVLLMPIAFTVARRTGKSIVLLAMPMIAGLSVVHAFIPPHPAAMAAVVLFHADLGRTMGYALLVGLPAAVLGGPLWSIWISRRIPPPAPSALAAEFAEPSGEGPSFALTVGTILLPVVLMLLGGWADTVSPPGSRVNSAIHFLGTPAVALLCGVLTSLVTFGLMQGIRREQLLSMASESLPPTAGALLMIGAGGGFGKILTDTGMSAAVVDLTQHLHLSLLLVTWLLAALVRLATGSSTVAMTTAASVVAPMAAVLPGARPELLVLAAGAGSIVLSHVNDGGFWMVKEYWNLSMPDTFKTWTACETILSVSGLAFVLALAALT